LLPRSQVRAEQAIANAATRAERASAETSIQKRPAAPRLDWSQRVQQVNSTPLLERLGATGLRPGAPGASDRAAASERAAAVAGEEIRAASDPVEETSGRVLRPGEQIDALKAAFGAKQGEDGYQAEYDIDGNGVIDLKDLLAKLSEVKQSSAATEPEPTYTGADLDALLAAFGSKSGDEGFDASADLDGDGVVGLPDLLAMLKQMEAPASDASGGDDLVQKVIDSMGLKRGEAGFIGEADLNADGQVTPNDVTKLVEMLRGAAAERSG